MKHYCRLILNIIFPIAVLAALFTVVPRVLVFFLPFVIGWFIAMLANPFIRLLHQKTHLMQRKHASIFIILVLLALIIGILYMVVYEAVRFGVQWLTNIPALYNYLHDSVVSFAAEYEELFLRLPQTVQDMASRFYANLDQYVSSLVGKVATPTVSASLGAVKSLPVLLVYTVVTVFAAYCFATEHDKIMETLTRVLPSAVIRYAALLKEDAKKIIQGWLLAQFKIMFVVFAVLAIGFWLLKIRYGILIAFITAFLDFLPMFGVGFVMWPWIVIELVTGQFMQALFLSIIYIATQVVRQVMQPKIMGDTMGLPPLWTIFFLYLGFKFYGLAGMIFSMPVGMLFLCFYRYGAFDRMIASANQLCRELAAFSREED